MGTVHDLTDFGPLAQAGKPVLLTATDGGDRHALVIEHQLRPLFGFFAVRALPTGLCAADRDFTEGQPTSPAQLDRLVRAGGQLAPYFDRRALPEVFLRGTWGLSRPGSPAFPHPMTRHPMTRPTQSRKIRPGAFLPGGGQHVAAGRHPDSPADGAKSFVFHVKLANEAERGLFNAYFLTDGLAKAKGGGLNGGNAKVCRRDGRGDLHRPPAP